MVASHDSLLAHHELLPVLPVPPMYFATHPAVTQAVFKSHRDGDLFITDNSKNTIFHFIVDMLADHTITPDDIIFTCSPTMTTTYKPVLNAAFSSSRIELLEKEMLACVTDTLLRWNELSRTDGSVNVTQHIHAFVCDMMCRHFLGAKDAKGLMADSMKTFFDYIVARFLQQPFDEMVLARARTYFFETVSQAINDKKGLAGDLVEGGVFDHKQIKMVLFSLMFAGMDSTASSLTYGILKIAQDVTLQDSVRNEIANKGKSFFPSECHVPLVRQIMAESLRMFTPVIGVTRIPRQDLSLKVTHAYETVHRHIPQGALIFPSQNLAGRCPLLFPDRPNEFIPARHDKVPTHLNSLAWSPFGGGPHVCPGSNWYETFTEIFLIEMMRRWNVSTDILEPEIEQVGHFINKLKANVSIKLDLRDDA
ncbi:MAG: cytochrome P450 [Chlamydiales bacterium]|nr:cytochrome P450 [Chlamydiales bacterium]